MNTPDDRLLVLRQHEFFRDLPHSVTLRCAMRARLLTYPAGARIFAKGDESDGLIAVLSGVVRISVPSEGASELTLNLIGPGDVFGEIALLDGEPRTADATAMQACRLLLLERRDFLATLVEEPQAAVALLKIVAGRLRRTSRQLEDTWFVPVPQRLAKALLTLEAMAADATRLIRMPQRQIGNMIGLSRESTNRYLRDWQRTGLIVVLPGSVSIRDRHALTALAEGDIGS